MWLFSRGGFYSVVEKSWDKQAGTLTVRARRRADLERLVGLFQEMNEYGEFAQGVPSAADIVESPVADYPFRLRAPKEALATVVARMVLDIDYDNFKNTQKDRHGVMMDIWSAARRLEGRAQGFLSSFAQAPIRRASNLNGGACGERVNPVGHGGHPFDCALPSGHVGLHRSKSSLRREAQRRFAMEDDLGI